jgi:hypothetical protein
MSISSDPPALSDSLERLKRYSIWIELLRLDFFLPPSLSASSFHHLFSARNLDKTLIIQMNGATPPKENDGNSSNRQPLQTFQPQIYWKYGDQDLD